MGIIGKILKKEEDSKETKSEVEVKPTSLDVATDKTTKTVKPVIKKEKKVSAKKTINLDAYKVISYPLITEKSTDLAALNKYVFAVPLKANKSEIKKAIESLYNVKPLKINIIIKEGKKVRHGRHIGKRKDVKKAIVSLAKKDNIEVYEGV